MLLLLPLLLLLLRVLKAVTHKLPSCTTTTKGKDQSGIWLMGFYPSFIQYIYRDRDITERRDYCMLDRWFTLVFLCWYYALCNDSMDIAVSSSSLNDRNSLWVCPWIIVDLLIDRLIVTRYYSYYYVRDGSCSSDNESMMTRLDRSYSWLKLRRQEWVLKS